MKDINEMKKKMEDKLRRAEEANETEKMLGFEPRLLFVDYDRNDVKTIFITVGSLDEIHRVTDVFPVTGYIQVKGSNGIIGETMLYMSMRTNCRGENEFTLEYASGPDRVRVSIDSVPHREPLDAPYTGLFCFRRRYPSSAEAGIYFTGADQSKLEREGITSLEPECGHIRFYGGYRVPSDPEWIRKFATACGIGLPEGSAFVEAGRLRNGGSIRS